MGHFGVVESTPKCLHSFLVGIDYVRVEEAAEEEKFYGKYSEKHFSGAEAQSILLALLARLKSCPDSWLAQGILSGAAEGPWSPCAARVIAVTAAFMTPQSERK